MLYRPRCFMINNNQYEWFKWRNKTCRRPRALTKTTDFWNWIQARKGNLKMLRHEIENRPFEKTWKFKSEARIYWNVQEAEDSRNGLLLYINQPVQMWQVRPKIARMIHHQKNYLPTYRSILRLPIQNLAVKNPIRIVSSEWISEKC